ncbi:MAG TPA: MarR family transcriptional regulator [Actinomycetota bacterium]|nr:MarR family transcriptional regulator [Actinomycetota bacterium]
MNELDLSHLLLEAFRSLDREIEAALEDRGAGELRPSQAVALLLVDRAGTRLSDLAHRAAITKQAMMQLVDDLQEKGCVRRVPDTEDARAKMVRLTAKGLRLRASSRKSIQAVESRVRRRLGSRRYDALRALLGEVSETEE